MVSRGWNARGKSAQANHHVFVVAPCRSRLVMQASSHHHHGVTQRTPRLDARGHLALNESGLLTRAHNHWNVSCELLQRRCCAIWHIDERVPNWPTTGDDNDHEIASHDTTTYLKTYTRQHRQKVVCRIKALDCEGYF